MFEQIGKFFKNVKTKTKTFSAARSGEEIVLSKNNFGLVGADISAVQKVVGRAAESVKGISKSSASVETSTKNSALKIHFTLELDQNFAVNDVSKDLVSAVRNDLEKFFAILDVEIYVRVTDLSKPVEKVKRRVR